MFYTVVREQFALRILMLRGHLAYRWAGERRITLYSTKT